MNKKLTIAILLPALSACAGHSLKSSTMGRSPSGTRVAKMTRDQAKKIVDKVHGNHATLDALTDTSDPANAIPAGSHGLHVQVLNNSGYPLVGVSIKVTSADGKTDTLATNSLGTALFKVAPGTYSVHAEGGTLETPIDQSAVTLNGADSHSIVALTGDEKGNGSDGPKDANGVIDLSPGKPVKTSSIDASQLASVQKPFSAGQWTHVGEMCKWQRMPWEGNNTKKLSFGSSVLSPFFVHELAVTCSVSNGVLTPKAKFVADFITGLHEYRFTNGSSTYDDSYKIDPVLTTDTPAKRGNAAVYSFNIVEGASQSVVLKAPTTDFYFTAQPSDDHGPQYNAFNEDIVGHSVIDGTDYTFVNYQIKEYWMVVTLNDGTAGPAKDGTANVQRLMSLLSGKSSYPIVMKDRFSSTADPDTFELAVRATKIATQDPTFAQNSLGAYVKAYAQAEAAQAGPADAITSWNYYRPGTQMQAMLQKLMTDNLDELDFSPLTSGAQWQSEMGLSLAYTKSPTNNVYTWKNALDQTHDTSIKLMTYSPRWGNAGYTAASPFGTITQNFAGAVQELKDFGPSLGTGRISDSDVQALIEEAKKNIAQTSN